MLPAFLDNYSHKSIFFPKKPEIGLEDSQFLPFTPLIWVSPPLPAFPPALSPVGFLLPLPPLPFSACHHGYMGTFFCGALFYSLLLR